MTSASSFLPRARNDGPFLSLLRAAALLLVALLPATPVQAGTDADWIARSDAESRLLLELMGRYSPETASALGLERYDPEIADLGADRHRRIQAARQALLEQFRTRRARETHPRLRQDLDILIDSLDKAITGEDLAWQYELPYYNLAQMLFQSFNNLLDTRVDTRRYPAALQRLKKYTGQAYGYRPITDLARQRSEERFGEDGLIGPYIGQVQQDRDNRTRYMEGMRQLFERSGLDGWQRDFKRLQQQLENYDRWLGEQILPRARKDHRLPPALYAHNLRELGVELEPRRLIERAQAGYLDIRYRMQDLAARIARQLDLKDDDYRAVLRHFKQQQLDGKSILPVYRQRLQQLEAIIRAQSLVTLPERPVSIRLASEAESAQIPAPHLSVPRLIGNTGQPAEFILPLVNPNAREGAPMDDFTSEAASWTLTAHEARPGHELQYAAMLDQGVSIARGVFAFNSANVEGWALYAEQIVEPWLPPEGQLFALQMRLLRAARAFLDPMLNLGELTREQVKHFLINEVALSEPMAQQEIDRYAFNMPGQATSYYYGFLTLMALRSETELRLGAAFRAADFHDFLLAQGLLPPRLLREAVLQEFVPAALGRQTATPSSGTDR